MASWLNKHMRVVLVCCVVVAHVAALTAWANAQRIRPSPREISVNLALPAPAAATAAYLVQVAPAVARTQTVVHPRTETEPLITGTPAYATPAELPTLSTPDISDREPDYLAGYLHNPAPAYPMLARRMGWQGKVIVSVEVMSTGVAGQVKLQQSSGHEVLDDAALQAVRAWRFSAARQAGLLVNKWFLVPIPFILKETE